MKRTVTPNRMRDIEKKVMQSGIPGFLLMEHAAMAVAREAAEMCREKGASARQRALFICGPGNNGGDGMAAARIFSINGGKADVFFVGEPSKLQDDAYLNYTMLSKYPISLTQIGEVDVSGIAAFLHERYFDASVIVDALFGIGLSRHPEGVYEDVITAINALSQSLDTPVLAVDMPSGARADTGETPGAVVRAARTVTFEWAKPGHWLFPAREYCGELVVCPIGLDFRQNTQTLDGPFVIDKGFMPTFKKFFERRQNTHKGDYGHVLVIAGSFGMAGAAALCAMGALGGGAGLVTVACPQSVVPIIQTLCPCAMACGLPETDGVIGCEAAGLIPFKGKNTVAIGPGVGKTSPNILIEALKNDIFYVIDADALKLLRELPPQNLSRAVLTPHPGELAYLTGAQTGDIAASPLEAASDFAKKHKTTVLLKGATTVISSERGSENAFGVLGTPGMATGGSGDVLTGVISALLARQQGEYLQKETVYAAYMLHALAGEAAAHKKSETSMTAWDIAENLSSVLTDISEGI